MDLRRDGPRRQPAARDRARRGVRHLARPPRGVCREAHHCTVEEAQTAPFCIFGDYARWKQVIHKELEPVKGMMQGKLKLKGNLQIIVRNVKAAQALVTCATRVPTQFLDEP